MIMKLDTLDIIIVNWNSGILLEKCINALKLSLLKEETVLSIFIIDNASSDDSLIKITSDKNIMVIKNHINRGFAAASNQGLKVAKSEYVLLLNPDTEVNSYSIQSTIDFMKSNSDVSVMGCKHLDNLGNIQPSCSRFFSLKNFFNEVVGLTRLSSKQFHPATIMTDWNHKESRYVDQVMGAYMFIRRDILKEIDLLDERFFVYFEDMDLSLRVNRIGLKTYYNSDIQIYHKGCGTTEKIKATRLSYFLKSRIRYVFKNLNGLNAFLVLLITLFIEPFTRITYLLLKNRKEEIKEVIIGYFIFLSSYIISNKKK